MSLANLNVVSFESRRADLVRNLIRQRGGECFNAPSVVERPVEANSECLRFVEDVTRDSYEIVVLTTGVGTRYIIDAAEAAGRKEPFLEALGRVTTVSRGPKPAAVLRQHGMAPGINVPEPNTWREVAEAMRELPGNKVAVQEYGAPNPELVERLRGQGRDVQTVTIYRWALPEDTKPLEEAARRLAAGEFDIALFLSSVQLVHLLEAAGRLGLKEPVLEALRRRAVIASIGPVMSDALAQHGVKPDFEPKHPKLAICVRQLADRAPELVAQKRAAAG